MKSYKYFASTDLCQVMESTRYSFSRKPFKHLRSKGRVKTFSSFFKSRSPLKLRSKESLKHLQHPFFLCFFSITVGCRDLFVYIPYYLDEVELCSCVSSTSTHFYDCFHGSTHPHNKLGSQPIKHLDGVGLADLDPKLFGSRREQSPCPRSVAKSDLTITRDVSDELSMRNISSQLQASSP